MTDVMGVLLNINLSDWKTLGFHPKPWKFFEKNLVKLLSKRNYIAFFENPFAKLLKPSLSGTAILYLVPKYRDLSRYFTKSLGQAFREPQR